MLQAAQTKAQQLSQQLAAKDREADALRTSLEKQITELRTQFTSLRELHEREASPAVAARYTAEIDRRRQALSAAEGKLTASENALNSERARSASLEAANVKAMKELDSVHSTFREFQVSLSTDDIEPPLRSETLPPQLEDEQP